MIRDMTGVEIIGPFGALDRAVEAIQDAALLQIEEVPLANGLSAGHLHRIHLSEEQLAEKASSEQLLRMLDDTLSGMPAHIRERLSRLAEISALYARMEGESAPVMSGAVRALHAKARSFSRRDRNLLDDLQVLEAYQEVAAVIGPLLESRPVDKQYELVGVIFERQVRSASSALREQLGRITEGQFRVVQAPMSKGRAAALVGFHQAYAREVKEFLAASGITEMLFPRYLRNRPFEEALSTLISDMRSIQDKRKALREQAEIFYAESGPRLLAMAQVCRDRIGRFETVAMFARTLHAFVIRGWVACRDLPRLSALLRRRVDPSVVIQEIEAEGLGTPPVVLQNPSPARAFEPLLSLFPLPRYGTIDPTILVAAFFPPIFGLMVGDVGYGAVFLALAGLLFILGKRGGLSRKLSVILGMCAAFTIGFGFVFGELFGSLGHAIGLRPLWRERLVLGAADTSEAIIGYLLIAVAVGFLQVTLGLILGILNARRAGERSQVVNNLARIAGIFGLFLLVGRLVRVLPPVFTTIGIASLVAFLSLMIYQIVHNPSHGITLPLEVLGTIGNILSYARIMAIGLASVVLALLASTLAGMIGSAVVAVIIAVLVHALNLVLGLVDPSIQGLRLQYVEFFSKFYQSGGRAFSPFRKMGGYHA